MILCLAHAFTVVSTINGMIDNLDDTELLCELLVKNGQNHVKRSIKTGDFKVYHNNISSLILPLYTNSGDKHDKNNPKVGNYLYRTFCSYERAIYTFYLNK